MGGAFDIIMRLINNVFGLMMIVFGVTWIAQGLHIGPEELMQGSIVGDRRWALYGGGLLTLGFCHLIWTNGR
jgi:hypothetical protein